MARTKLTQRKLAEALHISQAMVSRLHAAGMPTTTVAAALAWRAANLDPVLSEARRFEKQVPGPAAPVLAAGAADPVPSSAADYLEARARREIAEAAKAEHELAILRGEYVDARGVKLASTAAGRLLRDRLYSLAPRIAAGWAGIASAHDLHALITRELDLVLQETADAYRDPGETDRLRAEAERLNSH
jgi:hypothetical protein